MSGPVSGSVGGAYPPPPTAPPEPGAVPGLTAYDDLPAALLDELAGHGLDPRRLHRDVAEALAEDLPAPHHVDVTSAATIPADRRGAVVVSPREPGTVAGLAVAELVFRVAPGAAEQVTRVPEGSRVAAGREVLRATGPVRGLLTAERTALNWASHLSGVATATARWVDALAGTGCRVLDTRKTLPGWRALQKHAVRCGGGANHRQGLADMAMVKDNHVVAAGGVVPAWRAVRAAYPDVRVEVEVDTLDQLAALLEAGCDHVLLDNMDDATMAEAVRLARGRATLEASGGITVERAAAVAATGVDYVSSGALTHSVAVLDLGLELVEEPTP